MSAVSTAHHEDHAHHNNHELPYETQVKANRLGLWLFFISEFFLFGALLITRFYLWGNTRPELSQELGLITTSVLLLSSYFVYRGETAMTYGDRKTFTQSYLVAALWEKATISRIVSQSLSCRKPALAHSFSCL